VKLFKKMRKEIIYSIIASGALLLTSCEKNEVSDILTGQTSTFPVPKTENAIDLGLSTDWAPYNIGANNPEDYGNYYSWGETEYKTEYTQETYTYQGTEEITGTESDAAHAKWGNGWRLPTKSEIEELSSKCNWKDTVFNGAKGVLITASNGNSIFLPAAGTAKGENIIDEGFSGCYMNGNEPDSRTYYFENEFEKYIGFTVRPVIDPIELVTVEKVIQKEDFSYSFIKDEIRHISFLFEANLSIRKKFSSLEEFGIAIYRNNELYAKYPAENDKYAIIRIESSVNDLKKTVTDKGSTIFNTKDNWSIGTYYIKRDSGKAKTYFGKEITSLELVYVDSAIYLNDITQDHSKSLYYGGGSQPGNKLVELWFNAQISIDTMDKSIQSYGVVIYKNNTFYTRAAATRTTGKVNRLICSNYNEMTINKNENGEYTASTADKWEIGTYIQRTDKDVLPIFEYQDNRIPLELTYTQKPSITIDSYTDSGLQNTSDSTCSSRMTINVKVNGGFFMENINVLTDEHISLSGNSELDKQILTFQKLLDEQFSWSVSGGFWPADEIIEFKTGEIVSFIDKNRNDNISRGATIRFGSRTEMDKTDIISNSLNYILLHNKNIKIEITDSNE